ncbi:hypothetical protein [Pedobacter gandavensis]|uniref:hypothetical protein n=1 Tax=Pedobacter gandavensis TaxID=2679963 RepID=UPI0029301A64|nr:hypothetical protein [Pedobacter gandavensis]
MLINTRASKSEALQKELIKAIPIKQTTENQYIKQQSTQIMRSHPNNYRSVSVQLKTIIFIAINMDKNP